jgi:putative tricarboxylic transport membrane protein
MEETFGYLMSGFAAALSWANLGYCLVGVTFGMIVGVLPGLGPSAGTAILLPLTFGLDAIASVIMLSGIYYGAMYGGTITSVLINTPGESASVITCLDGYPLAKQGRAGVALGMAGFGSFIGGSVAILGLVVLGPIVAAQALKFGPPEYFCLMVLGMTLITGLLGKSLVKGMMGAFLGLVLSLIGLDTSSGSRFTMGLDYLMGGLDFIGMAMGLFGLSEIFLSLEQDLKKQITIPPIKGLFPTKKEWPPVIKAILRGTGLGFFIGLIPGTNSVIPTIISYSMEKKLSKHPEKFGTGVVEGVAGPETANNAYCGGALIPLFTLGIPTSPTIAVLLGAFVMHGLTPGPTLFAKNPDFVWAVIASMFIGNAILVVMNMPMAGLWAQLTRVPTRVMFPIIIIVALLGIYGLNNTMWDVGFMILFGFIGYFMKKADFPLAPIILTFVLGDILESALVQSMTIFKGNVMLFFQRPLCLLLLVLTAVVLVVSVLTGKKRKAVYGEDETEI